MKKLLLVAIAGLTVPTACRPSPEAAAIDTNAAMIEDGLEKQADAMEAMAGNAADGDTARAMENAADQLEASKANVADAAATAKKKLRR